MKAKKFLALLLTLALVAGFMTVPVLADGPDGPAPEPGLVIVDGSCGTLVTATEETAFITLENQSVEAVEIDLCVLGKTSKVTIAAGESYTYTAPAVYDENGDAYKLSLTGTDGDMTSEYPITAGSNLDSSLSYTLTLVRGVLDYYVSHGQETARWITCFIYADENGVDPEKSVLAGVQGDVKAGDKEIKDVSILSLSDNTAAIRAGGTGTLTVSGADIKLYGNGGDDFTGIGSALGVADTATLTVSDTNIFTQGILRCAIFAGDSGEMNLDGVTVECAPGEYQQNVSIPSAGMASPPNGLGIWGNCRAMNLVDSATVNIVNSEITSQDWGALGVDDVKDGHLNVKDSTIRITDQGYGAYAIGKCVDVFENCVFDIEYGVVGYAAAGDGSEMILSSGSKADSKNYYGFVTHQSFNGLNSKITVTGEGTELHAALGGIIAKGRGADIEISEGAVVTADSGVLVRAQINDDTGAGSMDGTEVVNVTVKNTALVGDIIQGMGKEYEAAETADAAMADPAAGGTDMGMMPPEGMGDMGAMGPGGPADMGGMGPGGPGGMGGSAKTESQMNVTLDAGSLEGVISSATLKLAIEDGNISFDNIRDVGVVEETVCEYNPFAKLNLTVQNGAEWIVTGPSCLMNLTVDEASLISAQPGFLPVMTVDGQETPIAPGEYTGDILLDVVVDENYVPEESVVEEAPVEEPSEEPAEPEEAPAEAPAEETESAEEAPAGMGAGGIIGIVVAVAAVIAVAAIIIKKKK